MSALMAQGPRGRDFGFGLVLGEPLGLTLKFWTNPGNAFVADIGSSWYGQPRLDVDYLWHENLFRSQVVKFTAGPGLVLGFGGYGKGWWYRHDWDNKYSYSSVAIGVRGMFGINVVPRNMPLEFFLGLGPMFSVSPGFYTVVDFNCGLRYYP